MRVRCGRPLDPVVLRSYCIGAAHMALGWVRSEGLAVDEHGVPVDLTIRSFGILRAVDTPHIEIEIEDDDGEPVNGSDAVFAAVATAGVGRDRMAPDLARAPLTDDRRDRYRVAHEQATGSLHACRSRRRLRLRVRPTRHARRHARRRRRRRPDRAGRRQPRRAPRARWARR